MDVINQDDTVPFTTADGSTIRELLSHRNSSIRQQSLAEARLAPGVATTPHHHAVTEEIYYILVGEAEMSLGDCLLYTSPSPRDGLLSRMPSSA